VIPRKTNPARAVANLLLALSLLPCSQLGVSSSSDIRECVPCQASRHACVIFQKNVDIQNCGLWVFFYFCGNNKISGGFMSPALLKWPLGLSSLPLARCVLFPLVLVFGGGIIVVQYYKPALQASCCSGQLFDHDPACNVSASCCESRKTQLR
jgi:hypothetical protein